MEIAVVAAALVSSLCSQWPGHLVHLKRVSLGHSRNVAGLDPE
jgi:hypothetical protein